jgi:hypothetical protein
MDCREAIETMPAIASGDRRDGEPFDAHLAGCAGCRAEYARTERAWEALGLVPAPAVSAGFAQAMRGQLGLAVAARQRRARARSWALRAAGWGLAAAGGFLLAHLLRPAPPPSPPVADVVRELLPASLAALDSARATDGGRLRAIAQVSAFLHAQPQPPAALVPALTRALRFDRNPGVRRKAAQALAQFPQSPEIRDAFLLALRRDGNPAVRIIAIGALAGTARALDPASIEALRDCANDQHESEHLRVAAARVLASI